MKVDMKILDIYEERLRNNLNKVIIISGERSFTFRELENYSNYISIELEKECINKVVPFYLKDNFYVLPVILGILKAGCIPLPLSNSLKVQKSIERIADVDYDLLVTDTDFLVEENSNQKILILSSKEVICKGIHSFNIRQRELENCYILCTSGTTGVPKKVFIKEDNIVWILNTFYGLVNFNSDSRFLFSTPYTFDVSLTEIFAPIFTGGILVCLESDSLGFKQINDTILKSSITHLSISPSFAELLLELDKCSAFENLKVLCIAGEQFPKSLADKLKSCIHKGCRVLNLYGPTETSIYATYFELSDNDYDCIPIGKPLEGVDIKLISEKGSIGSSGEICIGGKGLTSGYLLQPKLKKEKFRFIEDEEYYFTGDYAHFDDHNNLIFDGRKDQQVQLNGIRVELDEISSIVSEIPEIDSVRVVYHKKRIYVFYKSRSELKNEIKENLPEYVNPISIRVEEYLFSQNRKLDVSAMIEKKYFLNQEDISIGKEDVHSILIKYGVTDISDLDSLDRVRFLVDIEEHFQVEILEIDFYKLHSIDEVVLFLNRYGQKNKNKLQLEENPLNLYSPHMDEVGLLNMKYKLREYNYKSYENLILFPNCTQERLYAHKQFSLTYFDLSLKKIDLDEIIKLDAFVKKIAEKIDIFRIVAECEEGDLAFRFLKKSDFIPFLYVSNDFISQTELIDMFESSKKAPVSIILISRETSQARFYFIHHILDLFSLNKLEKIVYRVYNNLESIDSIQYSSYYDFRKFIESANSISNTTHLIDLIPITNNNIDMKKVDNIVWVAEIDYDGSRSVKDITLFSIYNICKFIIYRKQISHLTGAVSYNFREFKNFESQNIIGDVHTKIPFEIDIKDNFEDFQHRFDSLVEYYSMGMDLRMISLKGNSKGSSIMKDRWKKLNLSFNYIGEVLDRKKAISNIKVTNFEENFINLFTNKGKVFAVVNSNIFEFGDPIREEDVLNEMVRIYRC